MYDQKTIYYFFTQRQTSIIFHHKIVNIGQKPACWISRYTPAIIISYQFDYIHFRKYQTVDFFKLF